jgi:uncharacterized membrane protein
LSDRALRLGAAAVALGGISVAGYLTWAHYSNSAVACIAGGGCETVQESSYSEIAGVPVAAIGLSGYSAILLLLVWDSAEARLAAATFAFVGLLFSAYLLALQMFVIDAFCVWCVANDVLIAPALALLTALRLREAASMSSAPDGAPSE